MQIKGDDSLSKAGGPSKAVFNPNVFSMPFHSCPANAEIVTEMQYIQDLYCNEEGNFEVTVPMSIPASQLYNGMSIGSALQSVNVKINTGNNEGSWGSRSHSFQMAGPPGTWLINIYIYIWMHMCQSVCLQYGYE